MLLHLLLACVSEAAPLEPPPTSPSPAPTSPSPAPTPVVLSAPAPLEVMASIPDVAERVVRSVVSVDALGAVMTRSGPRYVEGGQGSGVIVDAAGLVVTNNHVIQSADGLLVTLWDGRRLPARLVGTDPRSDVALLRIEDPPDDLEALPWGDSDALRLGETVLAVGNPYGVGQTVTMGIVSAKGRGTGALDYEDFIQTDAAVNPGNSGGALVNLRGELVGINSMIYSRSGGYDGISFAIPASMARPVAADLLDNGRMDRGWLGVSLADGQGGVVVAGVGTGSPAAEAGLLPGDVVRTFNGQAVEDSRRFRSMIAEAGAGKAFVVEVLRQGESLQIEGTLGRSR